MSTQHPISSPAAAPGATNSAVGGTGAAAAVNVAGRRYFVAPDAFGNETIWRESGDYPKPILGAGGPDRDEEAFHLVIALIERADKAETELTRLREGLEALAERALCPWDANSVRALMAGGEGQ